MDDRELIELAAKAMGLGDPYVWDHWPRIKKPAFINEQNDIVFFDPLTDDQDAFRLACNLRIGVCFAEGVVSSIVMLARDGNVTPVQGVPVAIGDDSARAARRAIVALAAEIGKKLDAPQNAGN